MTTIKDLLNDLWDKAYEQGAIDTTEPIQEENEDIKEAAVDEIIETIKERIVG